MRKKKFIVTFDIWGTLLENKSYKKQRIEILTDYLNVLGANTNTVEVTSAYSKTYSNLLTGNGEQFIPLEIRVRKIVENATGLKCNENSIAQIIELFQSPVLLDMPPPLFRSSRLFIELLDCCYLGIISDTGFTIPKTIEQVLSNYGIDMHQFEYKNYSEIYGKNKPCFQMFKSIVNNDYGISRDNIIHVGDRWETDGIGAMNSGIKFIYVGEKDSKAYMSKSYSVQSINLAIKLINRLLQKE